MKQLKLAALLVFGLSIIFYLFFDFCKHAPTLGVTNPFAEDPYDAVGSFGIQLAIVSTVLTLLRAFRPYSQKEVVAGQVLLLLRSEMVALLSVIVTLSADSIGLGRAVLRNGGFPAAGSLTVLVGGMALVTLAAGWFVIQVAQSAEVPSTRRPIRRAGIISGLAILVMAFYPLALRNSGVPGGIFTALIGMVLLFATVWGLAMAIFPAIEFEYEDIFSDLSAIFQGWKNRPNCLVAPVTWMGKLAAFPLVNRLIIWLNPRRHRWNLIILAAVAMGLLLVLVEAEAEGMAPNLGRALVVVGVYISLEGAGVVLGYLLFGKYLGIFQTE